MHKSTLMLAGAFALAASVAFAQPNNGGGVRPQASGDAHSAARMVALVAPFDFGGLIRSKNVASVTNPDTGLYCITPKPAVKFDNTRIVPSVSVEWGWSSGNDLLAFYFSNEPGFFTDCPLGDIEVRTYDFVGSLSNRVAFTIVVN